MHPTSRKIVRGMRWGGTAMLLIACARRKRTSARGFRDVRAGERLADKDLEGKQHEQRSQDRIAIPCQPGQTFNGGDLGISPCGRALLCRVELTRFRAQGNLAAAFNSLMCGSRK
jgi:hypothetical protein